MRYINKSRWWRQAGDILVPPGGVTPDMDTPPIGPDWEPVEQAHNEPVQGSAVEVTEPKRGGRK